MFQNNYERIKNWLRDNREAGISFLSTIVQQPSIQGNEYKVQRIIVEKLEEIGLETKIIEMEQHIKSHPAYFSNRESLKESINVVGMMKGEGGGRSLILNGHVDVVPVGSEKDWEEEPFSGKVRDGKMYGRGTTDMKGGNVSLLLALEAIKSLGITLKGDVIFQSVIEEESGGSGTLQTILKGYKADAALIPEPTNMKIFPAQQGSIWFRIYIKGKSAHGGTRYKGVSAIEKSLIVIDHINSLERERNESIDNPLFKDIPIPIPINLGVIEGGEWPSSVPDMVKLEGRMGVAPDEKIEDAKKQLENWVQNLKEKDEWFKDNPPEVEWFGARWLPGSIDINHEFIQILSQHYRNVLQGEPVIEASPWGTDGGMLTQIGETPSIVFGPGVTNMAHYANEYIEIDKVFEAAEIIAYSIIDWCGVA